MNLAPVDHDIVFVHLPIDLQRAKREFVKVHMSFPEQSCLCWLFVFRIHNLAHNRARNDSFSFASFVTSDCRTGSPISDAESCSEPGTTRTSKTTPVGISFSRVCLPFTNSKTSRFGCLNILKTASARNLGEVFPVGLQRNEIKLCPVQ